jgi:hypothetical protein
MLEEGEDNCFRVLGWFNDSCIASSLNQADLANLGFFVRPSTSLCCEFKGTGIWFIH